jgi:hypothetical protein
MAATGEKPMAVDIPVPCDRDGRCRRCSGHSHVVVAGATTRGQSSKPRSPLRVARDPCSVSGMVFNAQHRPVLRWIGDGCPGVVMHGYAHRSPRAALRARGLVRVSGRGPGWRAELTDWGRAWLAGAGSGDDHAARLRDTSRTAASRRPADNTSGADGGVAARPAVSGR